ncbi:MAG: acetoin utilization protein AcuC [Armatimonadetes bacterium]|nr:acetoin utilization protein AcuC [Armatimonadota bacterium]
MPKPIFFYSDTFVNYDMGEQHPMKPERLYKTCELLQSYGVFNEAIELQSPSPATTAEVIKTHHRNFVTAVESVSAGIHMPGIHRYGLGGGDNPIFAGMYEASLLYTGGSIDAAQAVMDGVNIAFNIAGGLHHAHYDRAAGFCVFNDCAIAIHRLRQKFRKVAYIDIDVHHGDGVQELFYDDPTVLTVSLHESGRTLFPGTGFVHEVGIGEGEGYSINLPFAPYTTDEVWLSAWRESVLPILKAFEPEAILLQMGADAHLRDPLAHICLSAQGWLAAIQDVMALGVPIVAVGGGGYNMTTVPRMWTLAVGTLSGLSLSDEVPKSYAYQPEMPTLTDHFDIELPPKEADKMRNFAEESVQEIKSRLFSVFGLTK